jgi:acyl-coenzyme A synthetase/AMP-(fatty) acid ligase
VRMSQVRARKNPITGSIVVADVVLQESGKNDTLAPDKISDEILRSCRASLASYKVPAVIRFVPSLKIAESGKLVRRHA